MIRVQKSLFGLTVGAAIALGAPTAMADGYSQPAARYYSPWSWTGCYLGANVGGGWTDRKADRISQDGVGPAPLDYGRSRESGIVGGSQVGCDLQIDRSWVIGVQGQFNLSDMTSSAALPTFPTFNWKNNLTSYETVTGRVGFAVHDALIYSKAGIAWAQNDNRLIAPGGGLSERADFTQTGWTYGGGVEWKLTRHLSAFVEYNHMDFGATNVHFIAPAGLVPPGEVVRVAQHSDVVLVGLNFRFGADRDYARLK